MAEATTAIKYPWASAHKCWCGTRNPYFAELYDNCGGTGSLHCICGGDFCICHWHGEAECSGCEDCEYLAEGQERDDD